MGRSERCRTLLTSNRPVEDWGKPPGGIAAAGAILDRLLHPGHVVKRGPGGGAPRPQPHHQKGWLSLCESDDLAFQGFTALPPE